MLIELRKIAKDHSLGEAMDCKILMSIVAAIFDYNPSIASSMKAEVWERLVVWGWEVGGEVRWLGEEWEGIRKGVMFLGV